MSDFFTICYSISLGSGITAQLITFLAFSRHKHSLHVLPKGIRFYLLACCFPFIILINLTSIYGAIYYLIYKTEKPITMSVVRYLVSLSSQLIRNSLLMVTIERIIATVYLEKYKLSSSLKVFVGLAIWSYFLAVAYMIFSHLVFTFSILAVFSGSLLWFIFLTHVLTLLVCSILHFLNKRMYNRLVYQVTLQRRYQIFENVKVLSFIFPPILIFTLIAPCGSLITIISSNFFKFSTPYCMFHIFYNLAFSIILIHQMWLKKSESPSAKNNLTISVINPFGKKIPVLVTTENYFQNLRQQWK